MGIFKRGKDQPGTAASQPEGDGPVTLEDRVDGGSPDTNQGKVEPMSPTPDHPEPAATPELSDMNVGAADPQSPSHVAAAAPSPLPPGSSATSESHASGESHRAPGLQGSTPAGEAVGSDVRAGAASMGAGTATTAQVVEGQGDPATAPAAGDGAAPGTSETQEPVQGVRRPDASEA